MQPLTNRALPVSRKPMSFMESLYLPAIFKGMLITFRHIFTKNPTVKYPEQKREFSPVFRGLQVLNRDEEGRENCTACGLCAVACPAEAINMLRCIFCGLCEEACPKDAIYLSETFTPADYQRKQFIYNKQELLIPNPITDKEAYSKALGSRVKPAISN
jgi:NADH-quinone oxidoreductase subunit I